MKIVQKTTDNVCIAWRHAEKPNQFKNINYIVKNFYGTLFLWSVSFQKLSYAPTDGFKAFPVHM